MRYKILYNILTSTDGAVRRMFVSSHLFWTTDYTFRYNIWTHQPGSHRRKHISYLFLHFTFYNNCSCLLKFKKNPHSLYFAGRLPGGVFLQTSCRSLKPYHQTEITATYFCTKLPRWSCRVSSTNEARAYNKSAWEDLENTKYNESGP